jgi:hypothetical protein
LLQLMASCAESSREDDSYASTSISFDIWGSVYIGEVVLKVDRRIGRDCSTGLVSKYFACKNVPVPSGRRLYDISAPLNCSKKTRTTTPSLLLM